MEIYKINYGVPRISPRISAEGKPLKDELASLDDLFMHIQALDNQENDILFVGDFNAPPRANEKTKQDDGTVFQ